MSRGTNGDRQGRKATYAGVTEDAPAVDIRQLRRDGLLVPGCSFGITWPGVRTRYFRVADSLDALHVGGERFTALPLAWTACTYGGRRPWFLCPSPGCGRRVAILYGESDFLCRFCRQLTFQTRRLDALDRALRCGRRLRVRLGGAPAVTGPLPPRPKGMHEWTYTRLGIGIIAAEIRVSRVVARWATTVKGEPASSTGSAPPLR